LFRDDFESVSVGMPPDTSKWSGSTLATVQNSVTPPQGSHYLQLSGTPEKTNALTNGCFSTSYTTLNVETQIRLDSDVHTTNGACINLMNNSNISASLRFLPKGNGKYTVKMLTGTAGYNGLANWTTVVDDQTVGTWAQWTLNINITDNNTGAGVCTVLCNGVALQSNVPFYPFNQSVTSINKVQLFGDCASWQADDIIIIDHIE